MHVINITSYGTLLPFWLRKVFSQKSQWRGITFFLYQSSYHLSWIREKGKSNQPKKKETESMNSPTFQLPLGKERGKEQNATLPTRRRATFRPFHLPPMHDAYVLYWKIIPIQIEELNQERQSIECGVDKLVLRGKLGQWIFHSGSHLTGTSVLCKPSLTTAKSSYRLLPNHKLIPSMQIASPCFSYLTKGAISYLEDKETS